MCGEELMKELQPPVSHQPYNMESYGVVDFCQLQTQGFAPGERQIVSDRRSCDPIWNGACGSRICPHAR